MHRLICRCKMVRGSDHDCGEVQTRAVCHMHRDEAEHQPPTPLSSPQVFFQQDTRVGMYGIREPRQSMTGGRRTPAGDPRRSLSNHSITRWFCIRGTPLEEFGRHKPARSGNTCLVSKTAGDGCLRPGTKYLIYAEALHQPCRKAAPTSSMNLGNVWQP